MLEFLYYGAIRDYILCPTSHFPNSGIYGKSDIRKPVHTEASCNRGQSDQENVWAALQPPPQSYCTTKKSHTEIKWMGTILHCKAILGHGQPGRMRLICYEFAPGARSIAWPVDPQYSGLSLSYRCPPTNMTSQKKTIKKPTIHIQKFLIFPSQIAQNANIHIPLVKSCHHPNSSACQGTW